MYIDIDISEEQYSAFTLYCLVNKINPEQLLKNYILSILGTSSSQIIYKDEYAKSCAVELNSYDSIGAETNRKCKKCGRINTHHLNSTCDGEWEDI